MTNTQSVPEFVAERLAKIASYSGDVMAVRTKTGSQVHVGSRGGSKTLCGVRFASEVPASRLTGFAKPCEKCFGVAPEATCPTVYGETRHMHVVGKLHCLCGAERNPDAKL
jgi:hypothetical protein